MELFWDIIFLTESQFLLTSDSSIKKTFQKKVIGQVGGFLNSTVKQKYTIDTQHSNALWRKPGTRYTVVYLPLYFRGLVWCKSDGVYFHVILPDNSDNPIGHTETTSSNRRRLVQNTSKEWLLCLLELASTLETQSMRLYIRRNDLDSASTLLRNLNWIGGKLIPNESRNALIENENTNSMDLMLGDEQFVIIEFEC